MDRHCFDWHGCLSREHLGDDAVQSATKVVLFGGDHCAGLLSGSDQHLRVHRRQSGHIQNPGADTLFGENS